MFKGCEMFRHWDHVYIFANMGGDYDPLISKVQDFNVSDQQRFILESYRIASTSMTLRNI